jgi:hypothetical protein
MSVYHRTLTASNSLTQAESAVQGEEAGGSEFKDSHVVTVEGVVTNLLDFEELDQGRPSAIALLTADAPPPSGKQRIWAGVMVVSNTIRSVAAYR